MGISFRFLFSIRLRWSIDPPVAIYARVSTNLWTTLDPTSRSVMERS